MAIHKTPYLTSRTRKGGECYLWQPNRVLRKQGWKAVALKDALGRHATLGLAMQQATWLNAILAAWRAGDRDRAAALQEAWATGRVDELDDAPPELRPTDFVPYKIPGVRAAAAVKDPRKQTVSALVKLFEQSVEFKELAPRTQEDYSSNLRQICKVFGDVPVRAVTRKQVRDYYKQVYNLISLQSANARLRTFRLLMSFAVDEEWRPDNPLLKFGAKGAPPRVVIWRPDEALHLVTVADEMGEHGVADAFVVALHTAQRRGDVLALPRLLFQSDRLALSQAKRGAQVDVPYTPQLHARVAEMRGRREANDWETVPTMIIDDRTGRAFQSDTFAHRFAEVRAKAAKNPPRIAERLPGEPNFDGKWFADTRDTAITRLALADLEAKCNVDLFAIAAISGHSLVSITRILKHYVAMNRSMADRGIAILVEWMQQQEIKV